MVRSTPCFSQRRPEVDDALRAGRAAGRRRLRRLRQRDVLHQRDRRESRRPSRNASRVTKIAWSPVAMPVRRERRFISAPTTRSSGCRPSIVTSKRPQARPERSSAVEHDVVGVGRQPGIGVQEQQHVAASPSRRRHSSASRARAARRSRGRRAAARAATVASRLPPSTTMTSTPSARRRRERVERRGDALAFVEHRHDDGKLLHAPGMTVRQSTATRSEDRLRRDAAAAPARSRRPGPT